MADGKGRPSKYDPKYCEELIEHCSEGGSFDTFAGRIGISRKTLYNWADTYPDFLHTKEIAVELAYNWWEKVSRKHIVETKDGDKLNNTNWVFNMKNRFGWRDKVETTHEIGEEAERLIIDLSEDTSD